MSRRKKWVLLLVAVGLVALVAAGCGQKAAEPPVNLSVWSNLTPTEIEEVKKLADAWAAENNATVEVVQNDQGFQAFSTAVQSGAGPDLVFGLPHDNLGTFWKAGLLEPVPDGTINDADYPQVAIDAVTYEGTKFAVPLALEAIALIYRTDKVAEAPTDWNAFITAAQASGFSIDIKNLYFVWPFISGNGGYVFKQDQGLDATDIGLANEGAVRGWQALRDFVGNYKLVEPSIDYNTAAALFQEGRAGMTINGPWAIQGFVDAGVPVAVAPIPTMENGGTAKPFVGVQSAFVSANSKNKDKAWALMKYLLENSPMPLFTTGNRIPALTSIRESADVQANTYLSQFAASAAVGEPMPNIPEMQAVWGINDQMLLLVDGTQPAAEWAQVQVQAVKDRIAEQGK